MAYPNSGMLLVLRFYVRMVSHALRCLLTAVDIVYSPAHCTTPYSVWRSPFSVPAYLPPFPIKYPTPGSPATAAGPSLMVLLSTIAFGSSVAFPSVAFPRRPCLPWLPWRPRLPWQPWLP